MAVSANANGPTNGILWAMERNGGSSPAPLRVRPGELDGRRAQGALEQRASRHARPARRRRRQVHHPADRERQGLQRRGQPADRLWPPAVSTTPLASRATPRKGLELRWAAIIVSLSGHRRRRGRVPARAGCDLDTTARQACQAYRARAPPRRPIAYPAPGLEEPSLSRRPAQRPVHDRRRFTPGADREPQRQGRRRLRRRRRAAGFDALLVNLLCTTYTGCR